MRCKSERTVLCGYRPSPHDVTASRTNSQRRCLRLGYSARMTWLVFLEYFKVLGSTAPMVALIALVAIYQFKEHIGRFIDRLNSFKSPLFGELSASSQAVKNLELSTPVNESAAAAPAAAAPTPAPTVQGETLVNVGDADVQTLQRRLTAEIETSLIWEFRYLNYFLVPVTQAALDFLVNRNSPVSVATYDAWATATIANLQERDAVLLALKAHRLVVQGDDGLIESTPKGRMYVIWRGPFSNYLAWRQLTTMPVAPGSAAPQGPQGATGPRSPALEGLRNAVNMPPTSGGRPGPG